MASLQEEIEDKVIDCIALGSGGRLVAFKPENPDKDLVVEKRADYAKKKISFDIFRIDRPTQEALAKHINGLVTAQSIKEENDFYLLFLSFDIVSQKLGDNFWVIPSKELKDIANSELSSFSLKKDGLPGFILEKIEDKKL